MCTALIDTALCCCYIQEVELFEATFYGLVKRVQTLVQQSVSLNCVDKVGNYK